MTPTSVPRRLTAVLALTGMAMATLTGCVFPIHTDSPPPQAELINERETPVTLTLTGSDADPQEFPARDGRPVRIAGGEFLTGADECDGDGFTVTDTATGEVLATVDEPVCGDTTIMVKADGTVTH